MTPTHTGRLALLVAVAAGAMSAWLLLSPLPGFYSGSALRPHRSDPPLSGLSAPSAGLLPSKTDPVKQRRQQSAALAFVAVCSGVGARGLRRIVTRVSDEG